MAVSVAILLACSAFAAAVHADLSNVASLRVEPSEIVLSGSSRQQQLQITALLADGTSLDVTHKAELTLGDPSLARIDRATIFGQSDGSGWVEVRVGSTTQRVPLAIRDFAVYPPVHFANDVVPILSKLGCNGGGCHGKASGQNGFKLSVFGFDPEADFNALTKEARGRRVFPASPAESLLLAKPAGKIPHGGGQRLPTNSADYQLLLEWIKQGMPVGRSDADRGRSAVEPERRDAFRPGAADLGHCNLLRRHVARRDRGRRLRQQCLARRRNHPARSGPRRPGSRSGGHHR